MKYTSIVPYPPFILSAGCSSPRRWPASNLWRRRKDIVHKLWRFAAVKDEITDRLFKGRPSFFTLDADVLKRVATELIAYYDFYKGWITQHLPANGKYINMLSRFVIRTNCNNLQRKNLIYNKLEKAATTFQPSATDITNTSTKCHRLHYYNRINIF